MVLGFVWLGFTVVVAVFVCYGDACGVGCFDVGLLWWRFLVWWCGLFGGRGGYGLFCGFFNFGWFWWFAWLHVVWWFVSGGSGVVLCCVLVAILLVAGCLLCWVVNSVG